MSDKLQANAEDGAAESKQDAPPESAENDGADSNLQEELSKLKTALESEVGDEKAETERKIKEIEGKLAANVEDVSGDIGGAGSGDVVESKSKSSLQPSTTGSAAPGSGGGPEGEASSNKPEDSKEEGGSVEQGEVKQASEDGEEKEGESTMAQSGREQQEDDPSKEVDLKLKQESEDKVADTTAAVASTPPTGKKSGQDSDRGVSRSGSRISSRASKPPSRSKSRRLNRNASESPDVLRDIPQLKKRGSAGASRGNQTQAGDGKDTDQKQGASPFVADPLERLVGPIFRRADVNNDKVLSVEEILRMFRSPELGLHLSKEDLTSVKTSLGLTDNSKLSYHQFIPLAQRVLMRVYQIQDPDSMDEWMELVTGEGDAVWFNRFTGEADFNIPEGYTAGPGGEANLIEDVIREIFEKADVDKTGYLSRDEFIHMLQSNQLGLLLSEDEILQIAAYFDIDQDGRITFEEFVPLAKSLIMTLYQRRDPSPNEWCRLNSRQAGLFWFNKRTGETRRQPPSEASLQQRAEEEARQQEVMFVQQTLTNMDGLQYELEMERQQKEEIEYHLATVEEEAEAARLHLEETGKRLDDANERLNENEAVIETKAKTIEECQTRISQLEEEVSVMETVKSELATTKEDLEQSQAESDERAGTITERDTTISSLREQISRLTVELRSKTATVQDQQSTIEDLSTRLSQEEARNRGLEQDLMQMPALEGELQKTETVLIQTQKHLDEKASALTVTRKNLRNFKEKNTELEQGLNVVSELKEKLHAARCEVHTLRQFVGGKTALVLQRERELDATKQRMKEMEEKDSRRAQVLASVLEKTARLQQETRSRTSTEGHVPAGMADNVVGGESRDRPLSCPALVPVSDDFDETDYANTFGGGGGGGGVPYQDARTIGTASSSYTRGLTTRGTMNSSRSPTKLPPVSRVSRRPDTRAPTKAFQPLTPADVKAHQRHADARLTGPLFPSNHEPGQTLTSIPISYALPQDDEAAADAVAALQLKAGDRVLVRRKRLPWESEPTKSSGIVRYVGRVDSEFVDNRVYVGVQLDDADGDHDGVVKGKRYFKCAPRRGLLIRISDVISVLAPKSLVYRPLIFNDMGTAVTA